MIDFVLSIYVIVWFVMFTQIIRMAKTVIFNIEEGGGQDLRDAISDINDMVGPALTIVVVVVFLSIAASAFSLAWPVLIFTKPKVRGILLALTPSAFDSYMNDFLQDHETA